MKKLTVNEIFLSINGETSTMGMPTTFIRLAGCNLCCWNGCDTTDAITDDAGTKTSIDEIIKQVEALGCPRLCLTGGEPLLHTENSMALLEALVKKGFNDISVETNGSIDLTPYKSKLSKQICYIMDLKPPSSGMDKKMLMGNLNILSENDEIKIVIAHKNDFTWAIEILRRYTPKAKILFSPMFDRLQPSNLVKWLLDAKLWNSRIQLQLHKYIWGPEEKGV